MQRPLQLAINHFVDDVNAPEERLYSCVLLDRRRRKLPFAIRDRRPSRVDAYCADLKPECAPDREEQQTRNSRRQQEDVGNLSDARAVCRLIVTGKSDRPEVGHAFTHFQRHGSKGGLSPGGPPGSKR